MAKYYYNGVLLPEIPVEVLASYPYAWIRKNDRTGHYDLMLSTGRWFCSSSATLNHNDSNAVKWYRIVQTSYESAEEWIYYNDTVSSGWGDDSDRKLMWSNHDIPNGSATSTTIYFYGSEPVPEIPPFDKKYLIRSNATLYTVTDGALSALTETEITASLFRTYGVEDLPDGALLVGLTDPEVLYWQDSTDELPVLELTVKGTPPLPQMVTSEPMDLTHESIAGISHAAVDASEDVRFAISFDGGTTWKAHDGSAWFDTSDTAPGMLPSTMNAITAEQWAEVVVLDSYMLRFWLPNVTAYVASVVMHYINP